MAYVVTLPAFRIRLGLAGLCHSGLLRHYLFGVLVDQIARPNVAAAPPSTLPACRSFPVPRTRQQGRWRNAYQAFFLPGSVGFLCTTGDGLCTGLLIVTRRYYACALRLPWRL
ncbi:MAG: hypothetical protein KatS3mg110_3789 [Pirellulaceae bacterium]|nr:MAG: hypothetical protein KatS3mg110_3776 [Pirellulaceae bacterium]GIW95748.1 MAG: hypothetical protein KatS3mg110_3789 [Pirellulaceae bacterium]